MLSCGSIPKHLKDLMIGKIPPRFQDLAISDEGPNYNLRIAVAAIVVVFCMALMIVCLSNIPSSANEDEVNEICKTHKMVRQIAESDDLVVCRDGFVGGY